MHPASSRPSLLSASAVERQLGLPDLPLPLLPPAAAACQGCEMPGILPAGAVLLRVLPLALLVTGSGATQADTWLPLQQQDDGFDRVRTALRADIERRVFPGCVALVGVNGTLLFEEAFGNHVYMSDPDPPAGPNAPVSEDARFDLASLTKVIATTTAVMQLYQRGFLELNEPVWKTLGSGYATHGKELILIRNLLLHNAGLPPDPVPNFWDPAFECPETLDPQGPREDFSCQERIYEAVLAQTLINPVGGKYLYSDLSMITMMFVVGAKAKAHGLVELHDLLPSCAAGHTGGGALQCWCVGLPAM